MMLNTKNKSNKAGKEQVLSTGEGLQCQIGQAEEGLTQEEIIKIRTERRGGAGHVHI